MIISFKIIVSVSGVHFDVREFHKVVLNAGAMPLNLLEKLVDDYISETKTAAQKE